MVDQIAEPQGKKCKISRQKLKNLRCGKSSAFEYILLDCAKYHMKRHVVLSAVFTYLFCLRFTTGKSEYITSVDSSNCCLKKKIKHKSET